jgi:uncharacterized protein YjbI with pentapeptide repeats
VQAKRKLKGSDFSGSDLTNSSYQTSDMRNVTFVGSDLPGATLRKIDLRKARKIINTSHKKRIHFIKTDSCIYCNIQVCKALSILFQSCNYGRYFYSIGTF